MKMPSYRRISVFVVLLSMTLMVICLYYARTKPSLELPCLSRPSKGSLIRDSVRYLIYTCVDQDQCFGWSDRQRAIVTTYLISLLSGRRFRIYMTDPCSLETFLAPNKADWIIKKNELYGKCMREIYIDNDHLNSSSVHQMIADFEKLFPEDVIYFHTAHDYLPYIRRNMMTADKLPWLQWYTLGETYGYTIRHLFTLNNDTQKTVMEFISQSVRNHSLICAHIRIGVIGLDFVRTSISDLTAIWNFLRKYNDISKYKIYVATDSKEIKEYTKNLFPGQIVDTVGIIDQMQGTKAKSCEVLRRVIIDQEILTKCDVLMLTRSTLGTIAAYMRNTSRGLYCFYKERVFPCNTHILHDLYNIS